MSKKSVTKSIRAARRASAEARQEYYDALSLQQKLERAQGKKEREKLVHRIKTVPDGPQI